MATTIVTKEMLAYFKQKLDGVYSKFSGSYNDLTNKPTIPTKTSQLTNDSGFKTTDTTYSVFVKSGTGAKAGLVPAPSTTAGTSKYLREDGTWVAPPNTTYSAATTSANGLMSASDKTKLDGLNVTEITTAEIDAMF